nr:cysteine-rich RLK (receptor-like protein kinase) 8 [Tanacetum cinerariifolium]
FPITTYRHKEENDDLLVYISPTPVATTKQSAEPGGPPLKLKDVPIDAPNNAPNNVSDDVPISALSKVYSNSDAPSDARDCSDLPSPSPALELDLPIAPRKDSLLVPKTVGEALTHFGCCAAMIDEMNALDHNVAMISFIRLFISFAVTSDWALHQLDVKNAFLHGDL